MKAAHIEVTNGAKVALVAFELLLDDELGYGSFLLAEVERLNLVQIFPDGLGYFA